VILFFIISIFVTGLIYSVLLVYCIIGWKRLHEFNAPGILISNHTFSIIIPARNEEENIQKCLLDIIHQNYIKANFEIILVDDFSEDETVNRVEELKKKYPDYNIHIIQLEKMLEARKYNSYKKLAIEQGVLKSSFEWIITTDADCSRGENWLQTISSFIDEHKEAKLISAPVCFTFSNTFFQKAQALEFSGLIGIGAACIAQKSPTMCNGANLIYRKDLFYELGGFKGNDNLASGDDEFLMHKIAEKYPADIYFLKSKAAIVRTPAISNIYAFMQQRKRWVSKSRFYNNFKLTGLLAAVYLFYLLTLLSIFAGFYDARFFIILTLGLVLKCMPEFIFLYKISAFFNQQKLLKYYLPTLFFQTVYVVIIGIYGNFGKYNWKGRKVK